VTATLLLPQVPIVQKTRTFDVKRPFIARPFTAEEVAALTPCATARMQQRLSQFRSRTGAFLKSDAGAKTLKTGSFAIKATSATIFGLNLLTAPTSLGISVLLVVLTTAIARELVKRSPVAQRYSASLLKGAQSIPVLSIAFASGLWLTTNMPAQAAFFGAAETWFNATFPDLATVTPLIFGVLRGLFLLYIAVSLIRVVAAARNDDDWQTMARTPMIIGIAVAIGELMTTLVTV